MAKKEKTGKENYRSAETGRFVSASYAKKHPSTTVNERGPSAPGGRITNVSDTVPPPKRTKQK